MVVYRVSQRAIRESPLHVKKVDHFHSSAWAADRQAIVGFADGYKRRYKLSALCRHRHCAKGGERMEKKGYHGKIGNSAAQEIKAVYPMKGSAAPKAASYAGNGVKGGFGKQKKKK